MKKFILVTLAFFIVFSFISCSNGTTSTILIDKSNIWLHVHAYPYTTAPDGTSTPYTVSCQLEDQSADDGMGDFSGVTITVNGYTFQNTSVGTNYWGSYGDISLKQSDTLTVYISHPSFGSVEATGIVPQSLTTFNTNPVLPTFGEANLTASYDLVWTDIPGVDEYSPSYTAYTNADGTGFIEGIGYYTPGSPYTLNVSDGSPYPYLEFSVSTIDKTLFSDFASSSALRIAGTNIPEFTNLNQ